MQSLWDVLHKTLGNVQGNFNEILCNFWENIAKSGNSGKICGKTTQIIRTFFVKFAPEIKQKFKRKISRKFGRSLGNSKIISEIL